MADGEVSETEAERYPDRNGERRDEDAWLLVRVAQEIGHWWNKRLGRIAKTVTVLSAVVSIGGGVAAALVTLGTLKADYRGLPSRVERLEDDFQAHLDTTTRRGLRRISENATEIDTLHRHVNQLRGDMGTLRTMISGLRQLAEANNCWIRVAAGEQSRFECSAHPGGR